VRLKPTAVKKKQPLDCNKKRASTRQTLPMKLILKRRSPKGAARRKKRNDAHAGHEGIYPWGRERVRENAGTYGKTVNSMEGGLPSAVVQKGKRRAFRCQGDRGSGQEGIQGRRKPAHISRTLSEIKKETQNASNDEEEVNSGRYKRKQTVDGKRRAFCRTLEKRLVTQKGRPIAEKWASRAFSCL